MKTILIAEDNPVNRELLRELLELKGYEVLEASDGKEAIARIEQTAPALVVLDLSMPVVDGFGVLRWIRDNQRFCHLPVVAATAYAMRGDREKALEAGFDGYVSKPIDSEKLAAEIERLWNAAQEQGRSATQGA